MVEFKAGGLVKSLAGHDKNELYLIIHAAGESVLLSDGRKRPLSRPKRKNVKHLQVFHQGDENLGKKLEEGLTVRDEEIRRAIRSFQE